MNLILEAINYYYFYIWVEVSKQLWHNLGQLPEKRSPVKFKSRESQVQRKSSPESVQKKTRKVYKEPIVYSKVRLADFQVQKLSGQSV